MDEFLNQLQAAKKKIMVADHMLTQTYPLVKDPKLLLAVLENASTGMQMAMDTLLGFERTYKRIPPYQDTFNSKHMALAQLAKKINIPMKHIMRIRELREMVEQHKKSPVEFSRQGDFIICDSEFRMKRITVHDLKTCINEAEQLNALVEERMRT